MLKRILFFFFLLAGTAFAQFGGGQPFPTNIVLQHDGTTVDGSGRIIDFREGLALTYDSLNGVYRVTNDSVGVGSITSVGNCTSGDCFTGTTGDTLTFNYGSSDGTLSYASNLFTFDKALTVTGALTASSYASTGSGMSSINQGISINVGKGSTPADDFRVSGDTVRVIGVTADTNTLVGLGTWDLTGTTLTLPAGGSGEASTVSDTATINMTLTGVDIKADLITAGAEAALSLQNLQGAVTDAQVPNNITITETDPQVGGVTADSVCQGNGATVNCDLAKDASGACAAGTVCGGGHTHGSTEITEADPLVDTSAEITAILDISGTMTDENLCSYESTGTRLDCDLAVNAGTDLTADLEEEVTEGSLADSTIVSADIKDGTITAADISDTAYSYQYTLLAESATLDDDAPPAITVIESTGTGTPRFRVADFDATTDEIIYWTLVVPDDMASGNWTATVSWYSNDIGANEDACWGIALSATTEGDADTMAEQAISTIDYACEDANATEVNRLVQTPITISDLDSVAAGDVVTLQFRRDADNTNGVAGGDGLTSDARLVGIKLKIPRS